MEVKPMGSKYCGCGNLIKDENERECINCRGVEK